MLINLTLATALLLSIITDIKSRKILNIVTLPAILIGFIYYISIYGFEGFLFSGKGLLVGFSLLLIPYLLGGMGAGDVKLMAAVGSLMGAGFVFYSFIYSALIGGVIALVLIIKSKGFVNLIKSSFYNVIFFRSNLGELLIPGEKQNSISFPYGIAIVLGTLCTVIWGGF